MEQIMPHTAFDSLRGWRLLGGVHASADGGGGCFNEVATVVAGHAYRPVSSPDDTPTSFSRVFAGFAMLLNDNLNDFDRQMLVPFLTRMEGSRDSEYVEMERAQALLTMARLSSGRAGSSYTATYYDPTNVGSGGGKCSCHWWCTDLSRRDFPVQAQEIAYEAAKLFLKLPVRHAIEAFDRVMKIGRQADPMDSYLVGERIDKVKRETPTAFSGPAHPYSETANYWEKWMGKVGTVKVADTYAYYDSVKSKSLFSIV